VTESWSGSFGDIAGFVTAGAALTDLEAQSAQLSAAVASGGFRIEPEAATEAARACREFRDEIEKIVSHSFSLGRRLGFGRSITGEALAEKFALKASGDSNSLLPLLRRMQEILEDMAQSYEAAGRSYQNVEDANRQAFSGGM